MFKQLPFTSFMSSTPNSTTRLAAPSKAPAHVNDSNRVQNLPGYTTPVFKGKEEQRALVEIDVAAKVLIALELL